ncbi:MAG: hypothetical protein IT537_30660 [Hyphomicrobiales bacterium]|nr:hypothetical protein [Hyphomicrobiales bacterium]
MLVLARIGHKVLPEALHVQEQLGELLSYLQLIEAAILLAERNAEPTRRGALRPAYAPLQALR